MSQEHRAPRAHRLVATLVAFAAVACGPARETPPTEADVNYSPSEGSAATTLDVYAPPGAAPRLRRGILAIHGGAWRAGSKKLVAPVARKLALHGFVVFAVNYRLAPGARWPAALIDLQTAVRFIRQNARRFAIDSEKLGAWGVSAGGHLGVMLSLVDDPLVEGSSRAGRIDAAVDASGPADLTILNGMAPDEDGILRDLLGSPRSGVSREQLLEASTVTYARPDAAVLILHGTGDTFVSVEHSERLHAALVRARARTSFLRVLGGGHDATTSQTPVTWPATLSFFDEELSVENPEKAEHAPTSAR